MLVVWNHFVTGHGKHEADGEGTRAKKPVRDYQARPGSQPITEPSQMADFLTQFGQLKQASSSAAAERRQTVERSFVYITSSNDAPVPCSDSAAAASAPVAAAAPQPSVAAPTTCQPSSSAAASAGAAAHAGNSGAGVPMARRLPSVGRPATQGQQHHGVKGIRSQHMFLTIGEQPPEGGLPVVHTRGLSCYCGDCWAAYRCGAVPATVKHAGLPPGA